MVVNLRSLVQPSSINSEHFLITLMSSLAQYLYFEAHDVVISEILPPTYWYQPNSVLLYLYYWFIMFAIFGKNCGFLILSKILFVVASYSTHKDYCFRDIIEVDLINRSQRLSIVQYKQVLRKEEWSEKWYFAHIIVINFHLFFRLFAHFYLLFLLHSQTCGAALFLKHFFVTTNFQD